MNKSVKEYIIEKNFIWKLLSLVFAIGLWFVVINTQNPEETRTYTTYIETVNYDSITSAGLTVTNLEEITATRVTVKVRGPRLSLDPLGSDPDISVILDMSKVDKSLTSEMVTGTLEFGLPDGADNIKIESYSKRTVGVKIERLVSDTKNVDINMIGTAAEGYTVIADKVTPDVITVSGAGSQVALVAAVKADAKIDGLNKDTVVTLIPYACDASGNVLDDIYLSAYEVEVSLKAHVSMRVPVTASFEGQPREGFSVERIRCVPDSIYITGPTEVLDTIDSIELPSVDVANRASSTQSVFYLENILPEGVKSADGTERIIVDVTIGGEIAKTIDVSTDAAVFTGAADGASYSVSPTSITVEFSGSGEAISAIDTSHIGVTIDVTDLSSGVYNIVPNITAPTGIRVSGDIPVLSVTISGTQPIDSGTETE